MKNLLILITIIISINIYNTQNIQEKNLEYLNRRIYNFNRGLDLIFFNKNTNIYIKILPFSLKKKLTKFFTNIEETETTIYDIFKKKYRYKYYLKKLIINNILNIINIFDCTNNLNILNKNLMKKIQKTHYMIFPIIGPGFIKSHLLLLLYQFLNPYIYILFNYKYLYYYFYIINKKSLLIYDINFFHTTVIDGYSFLKSAYIQKKIII